MILYYRLISGMRATEVISFVLLFVLNGHLTEAGNRTASYISAHDFLFISGWPQSGTSLLQQILSISPASSTLIEKCSQHIKGGSKCMNWNYEGQWALKFHPGDQKSSSADAVNLINAGSMCEGKTKLVNMRDNQERMTPVHVPQKNNRVGPKYLTNLNDAVHHITETWGTMWNLEKKLLVEKSPQSMLKTSLLREVFAEANSIKFLIVLKHPATLNVALPKGYNWITRDMIGAGNATNRQYGSQRQPRVIPLTVAEIEKNAKYFIKFMKERRIGGGSKCTMGWLTAMHTLRNSLLRNAQANITGDTKIVRYEDFASPLPTCQSLFRFIHDKNNTAYTEAEIEVCQKHFTNRSKSFDNLNGDNDGYTKNDQQPESRKELLSSSNRQGLKGHSPGVVKPPITNPTELPSAINLSSNIQHTQDMNEKNVTSSIVSRKLRLKWASSHTIYLKSPSTILEFQPDIHKSSTLGRLAGYQAAYKVLTPETKRELDSISRLLKFFGYSLEENNELWDNKSISALDRWVLKPDS